MFKIRPFSFVLVALVAAESPVFAHKMFVEGKLDGNRIRVEAFFEGENSPAPEAKITIVNENMEVVAEGKTDEKGTWSCPTPAPGRYTIRAKTVGHTADPYPLIVSEFPRESQSSQPKGLPEEKKSEKTVTREEQTSTPWWKIMIGFGAIVVLFAILWLSRRGSKATER